MGKTYRDRVAQYVFKDAEINLKDQEKAIVSTFRVCTGYFGIDNTAGRTLLIPTEGDSWNVGLERYGNQRRLRSRMKWKARKKQRAKEQEKLRNLDNNEI